AFRGKHLSLTVRFSNQGRQIDDLDIPSHTNDTVGSVRRCILNHINANVAHTKVELFVGGELVDSEDDKKLVEQLNLRDKSLITAKFVQINPNMPSSPDSSSDSSTGFPGIHCHMYSDVPIPEMESCLPGVVVYALLMPAGAPLAEISSDFQCHFLKSGGLPLVLSMLIKNNFLPDTDVETRRDAYFNALKIAKLLLTTIGYGHVQAVAGACQPVADGTDPKTP
ncbi:putative ubiquitin carboxyl-terminal hydrolase FAF-X, partial [Sigmodon hispidus]